MAEDGEGAKSGPRRQHRVRVRRCSIVSEHLVLRVHGADDSEEVPLDPDLHSEKVREALGEGQALERGRWAKREQMLISDFFDTLGRPGDGPSCGQTDGELL